MKWLFIAVLIFARQPAKAPESQGTAKADDAKSAAAPKQGTANQKQSGKSTAAPTQAPVVKESQGSVSTADGHAAQTAQQTSEQDRKTQTYLTWFTGVLAVVGAFQLVVMFLTWRVYSRQAREMRRSRHEMVRQRTELSGQRSAMESQLKTMREQLGEMQSASGQTAELVKHASQQATALSDAAAAMQESAKAERIAAQASLRGMELYAKQYEVSKASAEAAKLSADVAARIAIPTFMIDKFEYFGPKGSDLRSTLKYPNVKVTIKNYGQTPAFLRSWNIIFTCEDLPEAPLYWSQLGKPEEKPPGAGIVLERDVVLPNEPYTLPELHSWQRMQFSDEDVTAIINREKRLHAYGFISYYDLFGSPIKRFKFCELALNFQDGWIGWVQGLTPDAYRGTDDHPIPPEANSASGGVDWKAIAEAFRHSKGQTASADTKENSQPEKAT